MNTENYQVPFMKLFLDLIINVLLGKKIGVSYGEPSFPKTNQVNVTENNVTRGMIRQRNRDAR
jgi:hypothetical protein